MTTAYAWANGYIEFGEFVPEGALPIIENCSPEDQERITARARLAYNGGLLVPGIPEAKNGREAMDALIRFTQQVEPKEKEFYDREEDSAEDC